MNQEFEQVLMDLNNLRQYVIANERSLRGTYSDNYICITLSGEVLDSGPDKTELSSKNKMGLINTIDGFLKPIPMKRVEE
jgi:hypothetical protein